MRLARERQRAVGAIEPGSSRQRACSVPVDAEEALLGKVIRRSLTMAGFDARRLRRKNPNALLLGLKMSEHFMRDKERGKLTHHTWEQGRTIRCLSGYISSVSESGATTTTTMILPHCVCVYGEDGQPHRQSQGQGPK